MNDYSIFPNVPNALRILQRVTSDPELSAFLNVLTQTWREDGDRRVAVERERCAVIVEHAFDHMSPLAIYESYRGGDRPVIRLNTEASARAIAAEIRKDRGCNPPQAETK